MGAERMGEMSLPVLQFLLTTVLGLIMTALGFYIKSKIFEAFTDQKTALAEQKAEVKQLLADFLLETVKREGRSDLRAQSIELRLSQVETGHSGITSRIDQLVSAIWAEHRAGTGIFSKQASANTGD